MSDLIEKLKEYATWGAEKNLAAQAADLIEQQQARVAELEQREKELAATVERLRECGGILEALSGVNLAVNAAKAEWRKLVESTPQQNLNALKREAWIKGYKQTTEYYNGSNRSYDWTVRLADTKYPAEDE